MTYLSRRQLLEIVAVLERQALQSDSKTAIDADSLKKRANYLVCVAKAHNIVIDEPPELNDLSSLAALQTFVVKSELALRRNNIAF